MKCCDCYQQKRLLCYFEWLDGALWYNKLNTFPQCTHCKFILFSSLELIQI